MWTRTGAAKGGHWGIGESSGGARLGRISPIQWVALTIAGLLLAYLLANAPLYTGGAVLGGILLLLVVSKPLVMIAAFFAIGPLNLSFITGGFKALGLGEAGGLDMNGIRLAGLVGGLSLLLVVDRRIRAQAFSRYGRFYLLFLIYATLTLLYSPVPFDGLRFLFKLAYPFLIFVTVAGLARGREDLDRILDWTLIGAAFLLLVVNPFYVAAGGYRMDFGGQMRFRGLGVHENPFSFYLLTIFLISLVRFWVRRQWRYLGLCGVAATWIVLTLTRSAMLGTTVAIGALGLYALVVTRRVRAVVPITLVLVGVAAIFVPAFVERTFPYGLPTLSDVAVVIQDPLQIARFANISGREVLWAVVIAGFLSSPVTGLGLGGSSALLMSAFPPEYGHIAHNEYLRLLADAGLIGAGLFGVAMLAWGTGVFRALRGHVDRVGEYALPAFAVLVSWMVVSLSDNTIDYYSAYSQYLGFLCAAAVVAARDAEEPTGEGPGEGLGEELGEGPGEGPGEVGVERVGAGR